ncbi:MAG: N-acetylmuramoyl-L-alanine amidase [Clostridia bacterium]|nr:N-acetylmuramoyl-L-alanine amidase [Clostridia bacterium]
MKKNRKPNQKKLTAVFVFAVMIIAGALLLFEYNYCPVDVIIDPGHGGSDVGAEYNGRYEKDDNLDISLKVCEILKDNGIKAALTRKEDKFISLENRCRIANFRKAKAFVALHRNSADNARGVEIWISGNASDEESALANEIMNSLSQAGISLDRGVKKGYAQGDGDYYINKHTKMSSCLVELGFINNENDNELFDKNIDSYAEAIAGAVIKYLEKNNG